MYDDLLSRAAAMIQLSLFGPHYCDDCGYFDGELCLCMGTVIEGGLVWVPIDPNLRRVERLSWIRGMDVVYL